MNIGFDFDNVLNDMLDLWCDALNVLVKPEERKQAKDIVVYSMEQNYPSLTKQQIYEPLKTKVFWHSVKFKPGAVKLIEKLKSAGHNIFIVSSSYPGTLSDKYNYCMIKLEPYIQWDNIIITSNKDLLVLDVLVDDYPKNLEGKFIKYPILFKYSYNKDAQEFFDCVSSIDELESLFKKKGVLKNEIN